MTDLGTLGGSVSETGGSSTTPARSSARPTSPDDTGRHAFLDSGG